MADVDWEESDSDSASPRTPYCETCGHDATEGKPLKRCGKCHETQYCSRECQKDDWSYHKIVCGKKLEDLLKDSEESDFDDSYDPFKDYHPTKPEMEVYTLLIDCFRMRQDDEYAASGDAEMDGIYGGAPDSYGPFIRFLEQALERKGLLPSWWNKEKSPGLQQLGGWSDLTCAIEESDIIEHYGNPLMPMQLRKLGSVIRGSNPDGSKADKEFEWEGMTGM